MATAQTGKWHKSGNKLKWIGLEWGRSEYSKKREHRVPEKKTEIALKLLRSAEIFIDIIVPYSERIISGISRLLNYDKLMRSKSIIRRVILWIETMVSR